MAQLVYVDDEILKDSDVWCSEPEVFEKALSCIIDDTSKYADDKALWAVFTPEQKKVVEEYYKGFAIDTYSELNGTVQLQIAQKEARVKQRMQEMEEELGCKIKADEWAYDGFKDLVDKRASCNFCKGSAATLRYVHYAINKKTGMSLRFGCDCAANFFSTTPETFTTIKTLQSKLLCDIKTIACICDEMKKGKVQILEHYYRFRGKFVGRLFIQNGKLMSPIDCVTALENILTFKIETTPDGQSFKGNDSSGYLITYRGAKAPIQKSADWVKEHIVYCLNADLDSEFTKPLSERKLHIVDMKANMKNDTTMYVRCAINFLKVGLPVPQMVCDKINVKVASATRNHHPDYLKFAMELLIHKNLAKTSLLRTAFTDFIVNYIITKANVSLRDAELKEWGITGITSYYNTLLSWESALVKLRAMKDCERLVKEKYLAPERLRFSITNRMKTSTLPVFLFNNEGVQNYIKLCSQLILSNAPVIKDESLMSKGESKYKVTGIDTPIYFNNGSGTGSYAPYIDARYASYHIAVAYKLYLNAFRRIIRNDLEASRTILTGIMYVRSDEELAKYIIALSLSNVTGYDLVRKVFGSTYMVNQTTLPMKVIGKYYDDTLDIKVAEYVKDPAHKEALKKLKTDATNLLNVLSELIKKLASIDLINMKITDIKQENEKLFGAKQEAEPEKSVLDYYMDYCNLLTNKPATETIKNCVEGTGIKPILAYKTIAESKPLFVDLSALSGELRLFKILADIENTINLLTYFEKAESKLNDETGILAEWIRADNRLDVTKGAPVHNYRVSTMDAELRETLVNALYGDKVNGPISEVKAALEKCSVQYQAILTMVKNKEDVRKILAAFVNYFGDIRTVNKAKLAKITSVEDFIACVNPEIKEYDTLKMIPTGMLGHCDFAPYLNLSQLYKDKVWSVLEQTYKQYEATNDAKLKDAANKAVKQPIIDDIIAVTDEHIAFFETTVTPSMRSKYGANKRDVDILRKEVFKLTKFETGDDKLKHFYNSLNSLGCSEECLKYVEMARDYFDKNITLSNQRVNALAETLCTELYNSNSIFNHFKEITEKVLNGLKAIDLYTLPEDTLREVLDIVGVYYLTYSDMYRLCEIIAQYGDVNAVKDLEALVAAMKLPKKVSLDEQYTKYADLPDSTGLTGVEKAEKVLAHADVNTLPDMLLRTCKTVKKYQNCSVKQLPYVNDAFEYLKLGTIDKQGTSVQSTAEPVEGLQLAKDIASHVQFATLPEKNRDIVNSVVKRNTCSPKQLYWVKRSAVQLGILPDKDDKTKDKDKGNGKDVSVSLSADDVTGLAYAKQLKEHKDFGTLPKVVQNIVNSVIKRNSCSVKQLHYIKQGADKLNIKVD